MKLPSVLAILASRLRICFLPGLVFLVSPSASAISVDLDLDADGYADFRFEDLNENGLFDAESESGTLLDSDNDNFSDQAERLLGTTVDNPDTDLDGITDGDEVQTLGGSASGYDPLLWDTNGDGHSDYDHFWSCFAVNYTTYPSSLPGWSYSDWDADGLRNPQDTYPFDPANTPPPPADTDGDGFSGENDSHEGNSALHDDWNNNGINDGQEAPALDSDSDGHLDTGDSHPTNAWLWADWDNNGYNDPDVTATDQDGDGILDLQDAYPTDPTNGDADHDGLLDVVESTYGASAGSHDSDGDGLCDGVEVAIGSSCLLLDTDSDGLTDFEEFMIYRVGGFPSISPTNPNSLQTSMSDRENVGVIDTDLDSIPDLVEQFHGLDPKSPGDAAGDLDGNGTSNAGQYALGFSIASQIFRFDHDHDGMSDIYEIVHHLNPHSDHDAVLDGDADGLMNFEEAQNRSSPDASDTTNNPSEVSLPDGTSRNGTDFEALFGRLDAVPPRFDVMIRTTADDWDNDGMPDHWEHQHRFGSAQIRSAGNADQDADTDGLTNLQEWLLGSNPKISDQDANGVLDSEDDWDGDGVRNRLEQLQALGEVWSEWMEHTELQIHLLTPQMTTYVPAGTQMDLIALVTQIERRVRTSNLERTETEVLSSQVVANAPVTFRAEYLDGMTSELTATTDAGGAARAVFVTGAVDTQIIVQITFSGTTASSSLQISQGDPAQGNVEGTGFYGLHHEESYLELLLSPANQGADLAPGEVTNVEVDLNWVIWDVWVHSTTGASLPPRNQRDLPVAGASLTFTPTGNGLVSLPDATTNSAGHAEVVFTGGTQGSTLVVSATAPDGASASSSLWLPSDWTYLRTEGTIVADLVPQLQPDRVDLRLSVTYSTWDVFHSNRAANDVIANQSSSPAEGAQISWTIASGDGTVVGGIDSDSLGITTAIFSPGTLESVVLATVTYAGGSSTMATLTLPAAGDLPRPDADGDGYSGSEDSHEGNAALYHDWNDNGINDEDETNPDSDGDGFWGPGDSHEGNSALYHDWNNNGTNDEDETNPDIDGDGFSGPGDSHEGNPSLYHDWNNNGTNDEDETNPDTDGDGFWGPGDSHEGNPSLYHDWNSNGINDEDETNPDSDGDGFWGPGDSHEGNSALYHDWNNNGVNDEDETNPDIDGDGFWGPGDSHEGIATLFHDWNDNGVNDEDELAPDSDGDGFWGSGDSHEGNAALYHDWNNNGTNDEDEVNPDSDGDGFWGPGDSHEGNAALYHDWNNNGINDEAEVNPDSDGDGFWGPGDSHEGNAALYHDWNNNGTNDEDESSPDTDGDGFSGAGDSHEGNAALYHDWNYNGINDEEETNPDTDGDGFWGPGDSHEGNAALYHDWNDNGINDENESNPEPIWTLDHIEQRLYVSVGMGEVVTEGEDVWVTAEVTRESWQVWTSDQGGTQDLHYSQGPAIDAHVTLVPAGGASIAANGSGYTAADGRFSTMVTAGPEGSSVTATVDYLGISAVGTGTINVGYWTPSGTETSTEISLVPASGGVPAVTVQVNSHTWEYESLGSRTRLARETLSPASGAQVTFSFASGSGILGSTSGSTNLSGVLSSTYSISSPATVRTEVSYNGQTKTAALAVSALSQAMDPNALDSDSDGMTNSEENLRGANPYVADTDGDGVDDLNDPVPLDPTVSSSSGNANLPGPPVITWLAPAGATPLN